MLHNLVDGVVSTLVRADTFNKLLAQMSSYRDSGFILLLNCILAIKGPYPRWNHKKIDDFILAF